MSLLIKKILSSIKNIYAKIDTINSKIENTRWKTATLTDDFKPYGNDSVNIPLFKKTGNQVEIIGSVSPTNTIIGSNTQYTIFTLPERIQTNKPKLLFVLSRKWKEHLVIKGFNYRRSNFLEIWDN